MPAFLVRATTALSALAAALVAATLLYASPAYAIANGEDVADGQYTFSAALSMPKITRPDGSTYASACSGALIAPQWIVSAGHCFHDGARNRISGSPRYQITVTVGQATLSGTTGQRADVVWIEQSPDTDLAVAKLATPVTGIAPLALADSAPAKGAVVRLVGWGSRDGVADLTHRPDRMQTGQFTVVRVARHELYLTGYLPYENTSACPYDSGAPYFVESADGPRLVATEITGPTCPHSRNEKTARIDAIATWIRGHISG
ncbi:MAG: S1 family peptidase [Micromonosporaceae bacterium]